MWFTLLSIRLYIHPSQFKGQLVMHMRVTHGNMQIQAKEGRIEPRSGLIRPSTRVSSYGLDSTMNLDALRVQCYKEVRGERKKKRNTVQRSIATATASLARLAKIETSGLRLQ